MHTQWSQFQREVISISIISSKVVLHFCQNKLYKRFSYHVNIESLCNCFHSENHILRAFGCENLYLYWIDSPPFWDKNPFQQYCMLFPNCTAVQKIWVGKLKLQKKTWSPGNLGIHDLNNQHRAGVTIREALVYQIVGFLFVWQLWKTCDFCHYAT